MVPSLLGCICIHRQIDNALVWFTPNPHCSLLCSERSGLALEPPRSSCGPAGRQFYLPLPFPSARHHPPLGPSGSTSPVQVTPAAQTCVSPRAAEGGCVSVNDWHAALHYTALRASRASWSGGDGGWLCGFAAVAFAVAVAGGGPNGVAKPPAGRAGEGSGGHRLPCSTQQRMDVVDGDA